MTFRDRLLFTSWLALGIALWVLFPLVILWWVVVPACVGLVVTALVMHATALVRKAKRRIVASDKAPRRSTLTVVR